MTHQRLRIALRSLRDVQGVLGSFVWRRDGQVVASDVPASCTPSTLAAVVVRVQRLCEALANQGEPFQSTTLVYRGHKLHVCGAEWAALAVVTSERVNQSALQLALDLSLRDLAALGDALRGAGSSGPLRPRGSVPPPVPTPELSRASGVHPRYEQVPQARPAHGAPPSAAPRIDRPLRSYRGQRLGE